MRGLVFCFVASFLVAYTLPLYVEVPQLWYLPLERRFTFGAARPAGIAMDWYGRGLGAVVVAGLATALAAPLASRRPFSGRAPAMAVWAALLWAAWSYARALSG